MTEIVESLKNELSSVPFFSRVFLNKDKNKIIVSIKGKDGLNSQSLKEN